jgi:hypothetical protein
MILRPTRARILSLLLLAGLTAASSAPAQSSGRGFLFGPPASSLVLRGGFAHASAQSEIFSFSREQLTLERGDFDGYLLGTDLGYRLAPRLDLVLSATFSGRNARSEMRDWVDLDDRPIEQTTRFLRLPLTASVKAYPLARGRSVGRFVWIPSRIAPFVGAGAGAMWYRFEQRGDFVDFETLEVFYDEFISSGWTPTAHALAGIDLSLSPRFGLVGEARYAWAESELSRDFEDFDPIDLSGLSASLGLLVRF